MNSFSFFQIEARLGFNHSTYNDGEPLRVAHFDNRSGAGHGHSSAHPLSPFFSISFIPDDMHVKRFRSTEQNSSIHSIQDNVHNYSTDNGFVPENQKIFKSM